MMYQNKEIITITKSEREVIGKICCLILDNICPDADLFCDIIEAITEKKEQILGEEDDELCIEFKYVED